MKNHPRVAYILAMVRALEFSYAAAFNMLCFYMTEQEAVSLLIKTKKGLAKNEKA